MSTPKARPKVYLHRMSTDLEKNNRAEPTKQVHQIIKPQLKKISDSCWASGVTPRVQMGKSAKIIVGDYDPID